MNGCVVFGCRRTRLAPRNGIVYATCETHTRIEMDTRPEWVKRAEAHRLPSKDYSAA